jgi:hypothetical protein
VSLPSVLRADADWVELIIIIDAAAAIVDITMRLAIKTEVVALAFDDSDFLYSIVYLNMYIYKKGSRQC